MTNEEAILIIDSLPAKSDVYNWRDVADAFVTAIKDLQNAMKYEKALNMMACKIVDFSKERECAGCPLKGSGIEKWGSSCKQKIVEYYKSEAGMGVSE